MIVWRCWREGGVVDRLEIRVLNLGGFGETCAPITCRVDPPKSAGASTSRPTTFGSPYPTSTALQEAARVEREVARLQTNIWKPHKKPIYRASTIFNHGEQARKDGEL